MKLYDETDCLPHVKPDGGPAFPVHGGHHPDDDPRNHTLGGGMTLRDWFAGQAITAVAIQAFDDETTVEGNARVAAVWAYAVADAMLAARGRRCSAGGG